MAFLRGIGNVLRRSVTHGSANDALAVFHAPQPHLSLLPAAMTQAVRFMSGNKLFIGGLAWEADEKALADAFSAYGTVEEAKVIRDRFTGRSRGFGFVSFASDEEAATALEGVNGKVSGRGGRWVLLVTSEVREMALTLEGQCALTMLPTGQRVAEGEGEAAGGDTAVVGMGVVEEGGTAVVVAAVVMGEEGVGTVVVGMGRERVTLVAVGPKADMSNRGDGVHFSQRLVSGLN
ncbi:unnamed protein product [Closterium sp. NIES-53]